MFKNVFVIAALFVAVSGCAQFEKVSAPLEYTTGVNVSAAQMATFTDKKTTKDEVVSALGQPGNNSEVAGTEIWSYGYTFIPGVPFTSKKNVSEREHQWLDSSAPAQGHRPIETQPRRTGCYCHAIEHATT